MENAKEYKEDYIVHNNGKVWRKERSIIRSDGVKRSFKGSWVATRIRKAEAGKGGGYEYIDLYFSGRKEYWLVHRLIAKLFVPNPNNFPQVNHIDGNRSNNDYSNLEWITPSNNQLHAYKELGRVRKSKLSEEQMKEVFDLRNINKQPLQVIADMYGISFQTVSEISSGKRFCLREEVADHA